MYAGGDAGAFDSSGDLGILSANTNSGVFGILNSGDALIQAQPVPVAAADEVQVGPAVIRSNVAGDTVEEYTVEITKLFSAEDSDTRDMMLSVTDPRLLEQTGGIVQGMVLRYNSDNTGKPCNCKGFRRFPHPPSTEE